MARPKKNREPEQIEASRPHIDHEALDDAHHALNLQSQEVALVDAQFGTDMQYSFDGVLSRLALLRQEVGVRLLEIGLLGIQVKAHEPEGRFHEALERSGIEPRFMQRAMQVARKFGGDEYRRALADRLGTTKVLALLAEDDADLDELARGGELAGHDAAEFARMTKREVVELLQRERREYEDEKAADKEIIAGKDERIHKLSKDRRKIERSGARAKVDQLLTDMDECAIDLATQMKALRDNVSSIRATYEEAGEELDEEVAQRIEQNLELAKLWSDTLKRELAE